MSQGSTNVPTGGSESATTYAGQCNTAWNALSSKNSGASAPANGPNNAPVQFQDWVDMTSATFPVLRRFDGVNWPRAGSFDIANSVWCPQMGGGLGSIVSAATTNIGAPAPTFITITGTASITSFGTAAVNGEEKKIFCGGAFTLVNGANLVCPGGTSIIATVGDIFTAIYDGAGVWLIYGYQKTSAGAGTNLPTGAHFWMYQTGTLAGAARANGNTIGNTGSGATEGTGAAYQALYTLVWNQSLASSDSEIVISSGRGANAAADFAALKTITLPDLRGRVPSGLDGMGNTIGNAGRMTALTMSPDGNTLGAVGGAQVVTLTAATMPAHTHTASVTDPTHTHAETNAVQVQSGTGVSVIGSAGLGSVVTGPSATGISVANSTTGSGGAHLNVQPSKAGTWYIAL